AVCIVARESVEKFGDLRSPEATVGTGPWMLDSYRPNVGMTLVRHPAYFVAGFPYIHRVEIYVDEDNTPRMAGLLRGKDSEHQATINRTAWRQIGTPHKPRHPGLQPAESPSNVVNAIIMRTDSPPYSDVRGRQAMSMAIDRTAIVNAPLGGVGVMNPSVPAGL